MSQRNSEGQFRQQNLVYSAMMSRDSEPEDSASGRAAARSEQATLTERRRAPVDASQGTIPDTDIHEGVEQRHAEQKETIRLDPVLDSPRFKGRRICYQRCPNMASQNIVTCEHCHHQYHIECLGASPEDAEDGVIRCEFCPDFDETESGDEEVTVEPTRRQERRSANRCPCGDETFRGAFVDCLGCNQVYHAECVKVPAEDAGKPFVCRSCREDSRREEHSPEPARESNEVNSCPCGQRTPLSRLIRCRTCNQAYHPGCGDGRTSSDGHFKCQWCLQQELDDELTARNVALRENYDQGEILRGMKLPKISSRGAEHAQRLLQSHMQRMAGEESFAFDDAETDGNFESVADEQSSTRPVPRPRQSLAKGYSLLDRLNADVDTDRNYSGFPTTGTTSSARISKDKETDENLNVVVRHPRRDPLRNDALEDFFHRAAEPQMQMSGSQAQPKTRLVMRGNAKTASRISHSGTDNVQNAAQIRQVFESRSRTNADPAGARAAEGLPVNKARHSDPIAAAVRSAQSSRAVGDTLLRTDPRPNPSRTSRPIPEANRTDLNPLLDDFEAVVVGNRMEETAERVGDLEQELSTVRARLRNLTIEHEKLKNFRNVTRPSANHRSSRRVSFHGDDDTTIFAPRLSSSRMDEQDLLDAENLNQQRHDGNVNARAAVHDRDGQAGGQGGNANVGNGELGEMGKAFISLAQQLSELQKSNRYATGLNNLKVLKGTEGSEGIRRYFREFELMTSGWSEQERVEALNVKLEERARLTLSSMPPHLQSVYSAVKAEILERLANDESKRVTKLGELVTGKLRKPSESIADFGTRVQQLVRDAYDPSVPLSQVDEMAKAYFMTYVNDRELIASLTEKQDSLEFRYLVDHAAALRANLDRFKRLASETSSSQQSQAVQQSSQPPPQSQNRSNQANRNQASAPQQQRINPYRPDIRYQSFPSAKGNFQPATQPAQRSTNAAADIVQPQEADTILSSSTEMPVTVTPPNSYPVGSDTAAQGSDWWAVDSSYTEPRPRIRRRRSRKRVHFQDETTSASLAVSEDHSMAPPEVTDVRLSKRLAYHSRCLLDVWQCLPFGQIQKFRPLSRYTSDLYASNKATLPCRYSEEHGRTCDGWYTEDEDTVQEEKEKRWYDYAPTLTSLDSVASSLAVGPNCTTIVRIRGVPCEALLDSGSRVSILEASYLKGILHKSGGKPENFPTHASAVASVVCGNRSTFDPAAGANLSVTYGSCSASVEFLISKTPMVFPLILGTNCLSDLGFELINKHTGEELLASELEPEGDEIDEAVCPAITVFAAAPAIIAPYQTIRLPVGAPKKDGTYLFSCSLETGTRIQCGLIDAAAGQADIWLTNGGSSPLIVDAGQQLGTFEPVSEVYTSSDFLSTDLLEEIISLSQHASSMTMGTQSDRQGTLPLSPEQRLQELLRLLGPTEMPLSGARRAKLEATLLEFNDVFALNDSELGRTGLVKHKIELIDHTPVRQPPRPIPYALREPVAEMVQDYYEREIIKPSVSSYSSPIVIARKKDQSLRFCVDYRLLNSRTKKFAMPLPNIDYLLLTMGPKQFFSSLDLLGAYWQLELEEESKQYTAFPALNRLWEFNVLSFGLTNAPGTFQEFMQRLFDGVLNDYVYVFLDDILIVSSNWEEHLAHIREVFRRLREAGLRLKPKKCRLVAREVQYLGHILSPNGLKMDPEKVVAVRNFPRPTCVRDVQSFHGLANHYRKFIKGFALIAHPLYRLIKKGAEFTWGDEEESAFVGLKRVLCEEVTLRFPDFEAAKNDPERPLTLQTDACRDGIAGILCQKDDRGALRPVHFVSRSTKGAELNYGITELEALSVKYCFNKLAPYLIGLNVRVETDHSALVQMFTKPRECGNARIDKWAMQLMSRFDFYVVYKPGKANAAADALSRHVTTEGSVTVAVMTRRMAREAEAARNRLSVSEEVEPPQEISEPEPDTAQEPLLEAEQSPVVDKGGQSWDEAMEESDLADVMRFLSQRELPKNPEQLSELLKKSEMYALSEGKLHFVDPESGDLRLVVPSPFRLKLFKEHHSGLFATHACGSKVYRLMKRRYWWPRMRTDCEKWARSCEVCVHTRKPRANTPPLQPIESNAPWDLLCMDILQLPQSFEGFKYALICLDHFSKYAVVKPVPDKSAESVASVLLREIFMIYGPCRRIHSDMGREFCIKIVAQLRDVFGMGQTTTAGYNARCNGAAERMGQRLIKMLAQVLPIPQSWVDRLPFVLFSYNLTPHRETGESPFFLLFFRDANFPSEVDEALLPTPYSVDIDDFRAIMMQNIGNTVEHVRKALEKARERAKRYYDARNKVNPTKYKVGQRVMVLDPGIGTTADKKLHWRFFGPFRIAEISDNNAKVYPIDKPHMEPQLVPLDRLSLVPAEVPNFSYARRPDRARIVTSCSLFNPPSYVRIPEFDDGYELATFPTSIYEHIVLQEAVGDKPRRVYESEQKRVLLINLMDESGLGPYWVCNGTCSQRCTPVLVRDVLPVLQGPEGEAKIPTLAHQTYIAHAQKFVDEAELPAVVRKLLEKAPSMLNREFFGVLDEATSEPPSAELITAQAHLRSDHCYRVRTTLDRFPSIPIKAFADNSDDHAHFTAAVYSSGTLGHPKLDSDGIGPIWERVRLNGGRKVTSGAFWALCPSGDEPLYKSDIVQVKAVKDLKETLFELRSSIFGGTVQAIVVGLPPATKECPARLQQILDLAESAAFDHIAFYFVPPPPSLFPSYATIVELLLNSQGSELVKVSDPGRSLLEVGRFGNLIDKRHVDPNGRWTLFGLDAVRHFIVDVKGLEFLRRDRLMRELAPLPPKPPKPPARLQSVVVVPPPRVSPSQGTSSGRPFRAFGGGRSGDSHRQQGYQDRRRRDDNDSSDQKRRRH